MCADVCSWARPVSSSAASSLSGSSSAPSLARWSDKSLRRRSWTAGRPGSSVGSGSAFRTAGNGVVAEDMVGSFRVSPISAGATLAATGDQMRTTHRDFHVNDDRLKEATRSQRLGVVSEPPLQDGWAHGWKSMERWHGRRKRTFINYTEDVTNSLGGVVAVKS